MNCACGNEATVMGQCQDCHDYDAQKRIQRREQRISASGLPADLQGLAMPTNQVGSMARKWVSGGLAGLCLTGPFGVGKTHVAAAACWLRLQSLSCRWISVPKLMNALRGGFDDEIRSAAIRAITEPKAVVLDDLDKVNPTEFGKEAVFTAIDSRIQAGTPLLVTTNLEPKALGDRYGGAIMSRLAGHCHVIEMQGEDRRVA